MELPQNTVVEPALESCTGASRFPPLSPALGNMNAAQAEQYKILDNALTKFYGDTIITKNADGSFTGPFGQLL